jgi:outer membrane protein OmpA-like peptidoglycan-associated protein
MIAHKHFATTALMLVILTGVFAQKPAATVQVTNEVNVNSPALEFSPTFYEDGIVFISNNNGGFEKFEDDNIKLSAMTILRSRRDAEGILGKPELFSKEVTSGYHEGPVCFSPTGDMIYFSRNSETTAQDGKQKMKLYAAPKSGDTWGQPMDLNINNSEFDDCHPALNIDGDKLYFASNRPGGFGGMDIYVSYKLGDSWSDPVNLGPKVNTAGNEIFPFVHADNTLYFTSTGHPGKGGYDLFQIKMEGSDWGKPVNLPDPFNTPGDDFGLIVDLNKINGYFSSNGKQGQGQDEIFSFSTKDGNLDDIVKQSNSEEEPGAFDFLVNVTDQSTGKALPGADVRILNMDMGDVIGRDEAGNLITVVKNEDGQDILKAVPPHAGLSGTSDKKGRYATTLHPGKYSLTVSMDGYQTKQLNAEVLKTGNKINVALDRVQDKVLWNASVFNYVTNAPLTGATAIVINKATGKRDTILTDENGRVQYYLDPNTKYDVELYQGGRLIGSTEVNSGPPGTKPLSQNISVAPLLPGTVLELPNIYYNYNDASLRPDARKDLDIVVSLMKQHAGINVELSSHTDARGSSNYNQQLSQRRANGVVEYLVTKGISRNRLLPIGHGETRPRNSCTDGVKCTEADYARNRRTEIKMLTGVEGSSLIYLDGKMTPPGPSSDPQPMATNGSGNGNGKTNTAPVKHSGGLTVSSGDMHFYVIAGSFLAENRAQNQLQTLKSAGYTDAEIIRFEGSNFYSVCAQKFANREDASALENKLEKNDKIDAFVRSVSK